MAAAEWSTTGADAVEILISPNVGEELKPLEKIASGGKLSSVVVKNDKGVAVPGAISADGLGWTPADHLDTSTAYTVDAVEQFQVVTSGGQAELGRALGGYVNVVTRSGTNSARGDVYGYFRDDRFNSNTITRTGGDGIPSRSSPRG